MRRYDGDLTEMVGVRFSKKGLSKLDHLAALTYRERSDVLRLLVELATARAVRDVRLSGPIVEGPGAPIAEEIASVSV